jgi:hypothetical protein
MEETMQQTHEIIDKLRTELVSLRDKTIAVEKFMISKDFLEVPGTQRALLAEQREAMLKLRKIMFKRLLLLRGQQKTENTVSLTLTDSQEAGNGAQAY